MSRQSQWLFEAPLVLGSDRYTDPYTNKENSSPKLVPRWRSLDLTIPGSYKGLEEAVQNWIHTCTMSKTEGGAPVHRERQLVIGNPSLIDIWNKILRYRMGQKTTIVPEYIWGPNRVESIRFTTTSLPPPPDIGNADFTRIRVINFDPSPRTIRSVTGGIRWLLFRSHQTMATLTQLLLFWR